MDDPQMLPSQDPDLAGVWPELTPTERLRLQLLEGEPVPALVSEEVRQLYREHHRLLGTVYSSGLARDLQELHEAVKTSV